MLRQVSCLTTIAWLGSVIVFGQQQPRVDQHTLVIGQAALAQGLSLQKEDREVARAWTFLSERGLVPGQEGALRLDAVADGRRLDLLIIPFMRPDGTKPESEFVGLFRARAAPPADVSLNPPKVWIGTIQLGKTPQVTEDYFVWRTDVIPVEGSVRGFVAATAACATGGGLCWLFGPASLGCVALACLPVFVATAVVELAAAPPIKVYVNAENVNLRQGPGLGYPIVVRLIRNQELTLLETGRWVKVGMSDGVEGYVAEEYLSLAPRP